ncbi:MAG: glycosyltransferase family 4 protein [Verrucomicrobiae bacterium]|nr:glycosyltransferase family 4 protein [Verrucomicrobiae bacterium]
MKICHLITRMIHGGAQQNTLLTLAGLRRDTSWDVRLACGPETGEEGCLLPEVRALGVGIDSIFHLRRNFHPWHDPAALAELVAYFRREKFDLVHTHSSKAGVLGRVAAKWAGIPRIVHSIHGLAFDDLQPAWQNWIYLRAERWAAANTDCFIAVCRTMAGEALAAGMGEPAQMRVVYSAFDLDDFLAVRPRMPDGRFVVGAVARMFPLKGHEDLMRLAPRLFERWPDVDLLLVGDGPMRRDWEAWLAASPQWRERICLAGRVSQAEVAGWMARMDFFVHLSWREGLARTIPQAFAAGVPMCVYNTGGAAELVENGRTGWLAAPGDMDAVMASIGQAREDLTHAREMAAHGREKVRQLFGVETMQRSILEIYREMGMAASAPMK